MISRIFGTRSLTRKHQSECCEMPIRDGTRVQTMPLRRASNIEINKMINAQYIMEYCRKKIASVSLTNARGKSVGDWLQYYTRQFVIDCPRQSTYS